MYFIHSMHIIFASFLFSICVRANLGLTLTDFQFWNPKFADRTNMKCPHSQCNDETTLEESGWTMEGCCVCYAKPSWEIQHDQTQPLQIEYYRRDGLAILININSDENSYLNIDYSYGILTGMPSNKCDFKQRIVKIKLIHNWIFEIGNISCLFMLDTLDLSYNQITYISNGTFEGLKELRVLKITNNNLQILEPATITGPSLQIFHADFSHNDLSSIEFSNMISDTDFCRFDYSSNKITEIINTNHFRIDPKKIYRGRVVELTSNNFTEFIDFKELGIDDIAILGKVMSYGFVMPDVKWDCDCQMEPYLELSEPVIHKIWRDYFNITCWNPPEYRGRSIPEMVKEGQLDLFICNLTTKEKCPKKCHCFYQPKEHRTVINCTDRKLTELPPYIPDMNNITLILKNNQIKNLEKRNYFKNVSKLDLSENGLESIKSEAIDSFPKGVSISFENNNLKTLPRVVQTLDPCAAKFGRIIAKCDCNNLWIRDWLVNMRAETCSNPSMLICERDDGNIPANQVSWDDLCPVERSNLPAIIVSVLCAFVIGIATFVYFFRYEVYLIKRKIVSRESRLRVRPLLKYDVFISFDEDNAFIRSWVLKVLSVNLSASGYRMFVPCRDLDFGGVKEHDILSRILSSRTFIVILSENYNLGNTTWTEIEWKYIWHTFKANMERNIIVINFDQFDTSDIMDQRLRAFIRLGYDLDFSNRDHGLMQEVKSRLGSPRMLNELNNREGIRNVCVKYLRQTDHVTLLYTIANEEVADNMYTIAYEEVADNM